MQLISYLVIAMFLAPGSAFSGSIKGGAVFSGQISQLKPYKTGKYKKACGSKIQNETILIDNKRIKNVVISLHGKKLKTKTGERKLDQKKWGNGMKAKNIIIKREIIYLLVRI